MVSWVTVMSTLELKRLRKESREMSAVIESESVVETEGSSMVRSFMSEYWRGKRMQRVVRIFVLKG